MKKTIYLSLASLLVFSACKKKDNDPAPQNNKAPVVVDEAYAIDANSSSNVIQIMLNDSDPEGDSLVLSSYSSPKGTLSSMFSIITGKSWLVYTPAVNDIGTVTLTYTLSDGKGNSSNGYVTVTVGNEAQILTWNKINPFINRAILLGKDSGKSLKLNTNNNTITATGLAAPPFGNGESWLLKSDGKLYISNGSSDGSNFSVSAFVDAPVPGIPYPIRGLQLTLNSTVYTFYESPVE